MTLNQRRTELTPDEILARVLHRDGLMLVIDKPAGLPVHRGPKGGANLESSFDALRYGLPRPPVLAHRLDRDTSGCLVLGRHRKATATLGLLFKHGKISKTYWAVVEGGPSEDQGTIDLPIGRLNAERGWWQKIDPEGLPSVTNWTVLGRSLPRARAIVDERGSGSPPPCGEGSGVGVPERKPRVGAPPPQPSPARGRERQCSECVSSRRIHRAPHSPGSRWSRSPAGRISCGCIARRWAGRSSATTSMATARASANRSCICTRARS